MKGVLYLVPVPLSEKEFADSVYPLLTQTVNALDEFVVEEVKTARRSLRKLGFKGDFDKTVFHLLNEHTAAGEAGNYLSSPEKGKSIGLMSEAGMPCIADPGAGLVRLAHRRGIRVIPLYGPSSVFLALAASGMNGQSFCFHGYLPKPQNERQKKLKELERNIASGGQTQIFIETPYRNNHLLEDVLSVCAADTLLCVASGITGEHESILTKSIADWKKTSLPHLNKQPAIFLLGK